VNWGHFFIDKFISDPDATQTMAINEWSDLTPEEFAAEGHVGGKPLEEDNGDWDNKHVTADETRFACFAVQELTLDLHERNLQRALNDEEPSFR